MVFLDNAAKQLYEILDIFFGEIFPSLSTNELYIAGEGYTAKFGPIYADYILKRQRQQNATCSIPPIAGVMIGNGWNAPCFQSPFVIPQVSPSTLKFSLC